MKVGVFLFNGYQELEFWYPVLRLREAGVEVDVIGVEGSEAAISILGYPVVPNIALAAAQSGDYASLVIPGGNVAAIMENGRFREFIDAASAKGAVLAAASQAAGLVQGKKAIVARNVDEVPQWIRSLVKELKL